MSDILQAILLGVIEGITEFLPISSTGHLLIAEHWLGRRSDLFNVAIQSGAIVAVCLVYRARLRELALGWREGAVRDYLLKLTAAFGVTAVLGLIAKKMGAELPDELQPVAIALVAGGFVIFAVERWLRGQPPKLEVTWTIALAVGAAQVIAGVFPGTSRSAAAMFAAMLAGLTVRPRAAEFAFLVGIPTMFAATAYEMLKTLADAGARSAEPWGELAAAFISASITGFIAVRWLLGYIAQRSFVIFGWYRILFGSALLLYGAGLSGPS